jgi:HPt (histidine-containing phosphotransfer) domain-containing protein
MKYFKPLNWKTEDAAQRNQADNELRQKLMSGFVKKNRNKAGEIRDAIHAGDIKLAHRLAHTLKTNAGQLNKILLQRAAGAVESCLTNGKSLVTPQQMATLKAELCAALAEFTPLVAEQAKPAVPETLDRPAARILLEKLEPLLKSNDIECLEYIDGLYQIPGSEELIQHMEDYDFGAAAADMEELMKNYSDA